jgi:hypothetical protein
MPGQLRIGPEFGPSAGAANLDNYGSEKGGSDGRNATVTPPGQTVVPRIAVLRQPHPFQLSSPALPAGASVCSSGTAEGTAHRMFFYTLRINA